MLNEKIGEAAGTIWHRLNKNGSILLSKLPKEIRTPELLVNMAVGWLAREDKIVIRLDGRSYKISLK